MRDRDDDGTFLALYAAHRAAIDRHLSRRGLTGADREDAAQLVWTIAYQRHRSLRDPTKVGSWLHGIAWRVAGTVRRTRTRYARALEDVSNAAQRRGAERWESDAESRIFVEEITRGLPAEQAEVLARMCVSGDTGREVAQELGLNINSVHTRLRLARAAAQAKADDRRRRLAFVWIASFARPGALLRWLVVPMFGALLLVMARLSCSASGSTEDPAATQPGRVERERVNGRIAALLTGDPERSLLGPRGRSGAAAPAPRHRPRTRHEESIVPPRFGAAPSSGAASTAPVPHPRSPIGDEEPRNPIAPTCSDCETCRDDLEALRSGTDRGVSMIRTAFSAQACVLLCSMIPACVGDDRPSGNNRTHVEDSQESGGTDSKSSDESCDADSGGESSDHEWDVDESSDGYDGSETDSDGASETDDNGESDTGAGDPLTPLCAEIDMNYCEEAVSDHCGFHSDPRCDGLVAECYPFTPQGLEFQPLLAFCRDEVGPDRPVELCDCLAGTYPIGFHACWNQAFLACRPDWYADASGSGCAVVQSRCYPASSVERLQECLVTLDSECPYTNCQAELEDCLTR